MKRVLFVSVMLSSSAVSLAQISASRVPLKKAIITADSVRITQERRQSLAAYRNTARKEKKNIFVLPSELKNRRQQEVEYIGSLEKKSVCKVDLNALVTKYANETEANLSKLFEKVSRSNYVLFFDEADALFNKIGDKPSGLIKKIGALAEANNVLVFFWCKDDCTEILKNLRYVILK